MLIFFAVRLPDPPFSPVFSQENKIGGQLEFGYGFGLDYDFNSAQIFFTPLYKQNEQLSFGLGVGFKYYYRSSPIFNLTKRAQRLTNIPVYAVVNYNIPIGRTFRPFLNLKTGYGISSQKLHFDDNIYRPIGHLSNDEGEKYHSSYNYENISLRLGLSF